MVLDSLTPCMAICNISWNHLVSCDQSRRPFHELQVTKIRTIRFSDVSYFEVSRFSSLKSSAAQQC